MKSNLFRTVLEYPRTGSIEEKRKTPLPAKPGRGASLAYSRTVILFGSGILTGLESIIHTHQVEPLRRRGFPCVCPIA